MLVCYPSQSFAKELSMRKRFLVILLVVSLCFCAFPVLADDGVDTVTYMLDGSTLSTAPVIDGQVTLADAPATAKAFCGWQARVNGEDLFLPAGATCEGISGDVTFRAVCVDFATDAGCSVRLKDNQVALRFTSTIQLADYETLVSAAGGKDKIGFGTYIVPSYYVTETKGVFTLEALAAKGLYQHVDVPAGAFYKKTETTATVAGSVGNIRRGNYTLVYTGVGYMKIMYTDGTVGTVYAAYNQKNNSQSILKTVLAAYNDRDVSYGNLIQENSGNTYSPYTDTELGLMQNFLDRVVLVGHDLQYRYFALSTDYYVTPWKITYTTDAYGRAQIYAEPPSGMSASDAMGIYLAGLSIPMKKSRIEGGTLVFEHDPYVSVG